MLDGFFDTVAWLIFLVRKFSSFISSSLMKAIDIQNTSTGRSITSISNLEKLNEHITNFLESIVKYYSTACEKTRDVTTATASASETATEAPTPTRFDFEPSKETNLPPPIHALLNLVANDRNQPIARRKVLEGS